MNYYDNLHRLISGAPYSEVPSDHTAAWLFGHIDCAYKFELISLIEYHKLSKLIRKLYLCWVSHSDYFSDFEVAFIPLNKNSD